MFGSGNHRNKKNKIQKIMRRVGPGKNENKKNVMDGNMQVGKKDAYVKI